MNNRISIIVVFIGFLVGFEAYGNPDSLLLELKKTDNPIPILDIMDKEQNFSDSLKLLYAREGVKYATEHNLPYYLGQFMLQESRVLIIKNRIIEGLTINYRVLELIKENKVPYKRIWGRTQLSLSVGYQELGVYEEAIKHRIEHLKDRQKEKYDIRVTNSLRSIGLMYLKMEQFDSSLVYYQKSLKYSLSYKKRLAVASDNNNIGLVFFEQRIFDSAQVYFERSIEEYSNPHKKYSVKLMEAIVGGNLAQCFPIKGNKKKIIDLLNKNIRVTREFEEWPSLSNAYFEMGNLYYETKEFQKSRIYLDSSYAVNLSLTPNSLVIMEKRISIYEAYISIFENVNDKEKQIFFMNKLMMLNDSVYGKEQSEKILKSLTQFKVSGIQKELKLERSLLSQSRREVEFLEAEEKLADLKITLFWVLGGFLSVLGGFYFFKMKSDFKKEKELEILSKKMLEASIENKTQRLTQTTLSLTRKSEFAKELNKKLSEIKEISSKDLSPIKLFISNELHMDENLLEMEQYISELSKDFFVKLKLKFPKLTENDIKLCGLIRQELSIKEISIVKNITPESVKISKNRLSKKMGLLPGTKLLGYLKEF